MVVGFVQVSQRPRLSKSPFDLLRAARSSIYPLFMKKQKYLFYSFHKVAILIESEKWCIIRKTSFKECVMLNTFYKNFKSGTDIRGVAAEGVKGQEVNLTNEVVANMTNGFALWLSEQVHKPVNELTVSVGRDSRISGPRIISVVTETLKDAGVRVINCELASTPSMFMTTVDLGADGAVQITASHHPFNRNGLKFFTREGGLEGSGI